MSRNFNEESLIAEDIDHHRRAVITDEALLEHLAMYENTIECIEKAPNAWQEAYLRGILKYRYTNDGTNYIQDE